MNLVEGRVMIFGTFDRFHPGHKYFIEEAKKLGSELVIVVARDKTVKRMKDFLKNPEDLRRSVLQKEFPSVQVILGDLNDYMKPVRDYCPALVCLGYDQEGFSGKLQEDYPEIRVVRLDSYRPHEYKSSKM
jgi:FAD synthetase